MISREIIGDDMQVVLSMNAGDEIRAVHGGKEEVRRGDLGGAPGEIGDLIGGDR